MYVCVPHHVIYQQIYRLFPDLSVANSAAGTMRIQITFNMLSSFPLDRYPVVGLLYHMLTLFSIFLKHLHTIFFHNGDTSFLPSNHTQRPLCLLHSRWHLMFGKHGVWPSGQMCCGSPYAAMGRAQLSATYLEDGSLNTVGSRGRWTEAWITELFRGNSQAFILLESRKHCRRLR